MSEKINKPTVLVLNRNWQAINVRTPADVFCQMANDVASGLDMSEVAMVPVRWAEWIHLSIREEDAFVSTPRGRIRVPTVVVLGSYDKVPRRRLSLSSRSIWIRDEGRCQYTGRLLRPHEGNIDHVVPRSRGGATSWENCVLAHREVNSRKADRLPHEAGLRLLRKPVAPRELPATFLIKNPCQIADWARFLQ